MRKINAQGEWLKLICSMFATVLIYCNVSVIASYPLQKVEVQPSLPLIACLHDQFMIFGVFSYYEKMNQELTIWGYAMNPATGMSYWKELPAEDYFPCSRGERQSRMWATRQYNAPNRSGHWEAWQFMGQRIMERYNRLHRADPITKLGLQSLSWPRNPNGFYVEQSYQTATKQFWTVAELPPAK